MSAATTLPEPMRLRLVALSEAWALLTKDGSPLPSVADLTELAEALLLLGPKE